jgi:hypothetical protein
MISSCYVVVHVFWNCSFAQIHEAETLITAQLVNKFPVLYMYRTRRVIIMFTRPPTSGPFLERVEITENPHATILKLYTENFLIYLISYKMA